MNGDWGEELASRYLQKQGFEILERNWRYSRAEVDIIARHRGLLIFVEVKQRKNTDFGYPESFVSEKQQQLLAEAAAVFCDAMAYEGEIRFDVISIIGQPAQEGPDLHHLKDAFFPGLA